MNDTMGTLIWTNRTQGKMRFLDQVNYVRKSMGVQFKLFFPQNGPSAVTPTLEKVQIPDTKLVRETQAFAANLLSTTFLNHSIRSYFWGSLLKQRNNQDFDEETFYLSCLLHDIGIASGVHGSLPHAECFTVESAQTGDRFLSEHGSAKDQRDTIYDAITLHLNPVVSTDEHSEIAHYLNAGTACDIVGARFGQIPKLSRQEVISRYPRQSLKQDVLQVMTKEAHIHPCSRMALMKRFGFLELVKRAPFDS